jgi:hypothetical protein
MSWKLKKIFKKKNAVQSGLGSEIIFLKKSPETLKTYFLCKDTAVNFNKQKKKMKFSDKNI